MAADGAVETEVPVWRDKKRYLWLLGLSGIASLVFGVAIAIWPGAGALAVLGIIAAYAIVYGVLLLVLGLQLRGRRPGTRREATRRAA